MLSLSCHCHAVRLQAPRPEYVNACNCSLCGKTGAQWGYYDPTQVTVEGATSSYLRRDKPDAGANVHFCPTCGSTTHFTLTEAMIAQHGNTMLGVNMALAEEDDLAGVERRFPDGRGWDGASAFRYVRPAEIIGQPVASSSA